jgi:hypothetical protein
MIRRWALALSLLAPLAAGGCRQDGTLQVSWDFVGDEAPAGACGQHGVDSILILGTDTGGDGTRAVTLCTPGFRRVSVPEGTWTVAVSMLDFQGATISGADPNVPSPGGTAVVTLDAPGTVSVHLQPPPACSDGVDNDRDGRVDLDDPDCQNDPSGTAE